MGSNKAREPGRRVTIADVARVAEVSNFVANDAFTRPERMAPERAERIRAIAAELGYTRRRYVKKRSGGTYGFLKARMEDGAANYHEWYSSVDVALHEAAHRVDATMLSFSYDPDGAIETAKASAPVTPEVQALRDFCGRPGVDGVIITDARPTGSDPRLTWLREARVPFVLLGQGDDRTCWLDLDNRLAAQELTGMLVDAGHRRVGRLGFRPDQTGPPAQRRSGYERIMSRGLLTAAEIERVTVEVDYGDERRTENPAHDATRRQELTRRLVSLLEDESVTALFCDSDLLAMTAQALLLERYRSLDRLPEVVGIDNSQARRNSLRRFASAGPDWKRYGDRALEMLRAVQADPAHAASGTMPFEIVGSVEGPRSRPRRRT